MKFHVDNDDDTMALLPMLLAAWSPRSFKFSLKMKITLSSSSVATVIFIIILALLLLMLLFARSWQRGFNKIAFIFLNSLWHYNGGMFFMALVFGFGFNMALLTQSTNDCQVDGWIFAFARFLVFLYHFELAFSVFYFLSSLLFYPCW